MTFTYEDVDISVVFKTQEVSLEETYGSEGIYAHFQRFLIACGYPIEPSASLVPVDLNTEVIVSKKEYKDFLDEKEDSQPPRTGWFTAVVKGSRSDNRVRRELREDGNIYSENGIRGGGFIRGSLNFVYEDIRWENP